MILVVHSFNLLIEQPGHEMKYYLHQQKSCTRSFNCYSLFTNVVSLANHLPSLKWISTPPSKASCFHHLTNYIHMNSLNYSLFSNFSLETSLIGNELTEEVHQKNQSGGSFGKVKQALQQTKNNLEKTRKRKKIILTISFSQRCKCCMPTCPQIHIAGKIFKCDLTTFKELQLYASGLFYLPQYILHQFTLKFWTIEFLCITNSKIYCTHKNIIKLCMETKRKHATENKNELECFPFDLILWLFSVNICN